ncbi:hypothetical protein M885DRAFT_496523 [Pelagophyceae sp. CCMP2097]|nr:hypothetical protein M885DRAFT_496523 [Pelagophyceae sp. CCMP2097]
MAEARERRDLTRSPRLLRAYEVCKPQYDDAMAKIAADEERFARALKKGLQEGRVQCADVAAANGKVASWSAQRRTLADYPSRQYLLASYKADGGCEDDGRRAARLCADSAPPSVDFFAEGIRLVTWAEAGGDEVEGRKGLGLCADKAPPSVSDGESLVAFVEDANVDSGRIFSPKLGSTASRALAGSVFEDNDSDSDDDFDSDDEDIDGEALPRGVTLADVAELGGMLHESAISALAGPSLGDATDGRCKCPGCAACPIGFIGKHAVAAALVLCSTKEFKLTKNLVVAPWKKGLPGLRPPATRTVLRDVLSQGERFEYPTRQALQFVLVSREQHYKKIALSDKSEKSENSNSIVGIFRC